MNDENYSMTIHNSTLEQINRHLPWTDRLWKQLNPVNQKEQHVLGSALFFGKNGLGKSQLVLRYAMQVLDNNDVFLSGNHPDVHVLMPENEAVETGIAERINKEEGGSTFSPEELLAAYGLRYLEKNNGKPKKIISVQQIRLLIQQVVQHPHLAKHKVIIIKSADKMNVNAANALLKTLEEPPSNTIFILVANQIERLPITIRSRCAEFHFRTPDIEIGLQWLEQQGMNQHNKSYLMMANRAPLAAIELSKQNEIENLRNLFSSINQLWARKTSSIELANEWKKYDFERLFNHLNKFLADLLKLKSLKGSSVELADITELFYPVQKDWSEKIASSVSFSSLFKTIDEIQSVTRLGEGPSDKQLLLENTAIQLEKLALSRA